MLWQNLQYNVIMQYPGECNIMQIAPSFPCALIDSEQTARQTEADACLPRISIFVKISRYFEISNMSLLDVRRKNQVAIDASTAKRFQCPFLQASTYSQTITYYMSQGLLLWQVTHSMIDDKLICPCPISSSGIPIKAISISPFVQGRAIKV